MYYPYLRGKQFELIALRELSKADFKTVMTPIIEPVRKNLSPLFKTVKQLNEVDITPLIVVNPSVGDLVGLEEELIGALDESGCNYLPCVAISGINGLELVSDFQKQQRQYATHLVSGVTPSVVPFANDGDVTIIEFDVNPVALNQIKNAVLIGDFFKKESRNADYKNESVFSHQHCTYNGAQNVIGFSDYTILPREFSESGGPAYVVTIHLSYINQEAFEQMFVRHYSSYDDKTPTDPGGKFKDALNKLVVDAVRADSVFIDSDALREFVSLNESGHYPGLGQVKKLSIKHHVETTCDYLLKH